MYCRLKPISLLAVSALLFPGILLAEDEQAAQLSIPPAAVDEADSSLSLPDGENGDVEAVLRGPVHEAFAETIQLNPQPGLIVPKPPPEPIQELPPELKPSDADIIWIPGYWGWDPDRNDFLWVSGTWRKPPQGHRWIPGYWHEVDGGWQWVSGTWVSGDSASVDYLDPPPESLERGPVGSPSSSSQFWVPGCWINQNSQYVWRPGYWSTGYDNWVWVPARYRWTPSGCIYSSGYWDYPLDTRGVLYAPYYSPTRSYAYVNRSHFVPNVILSSSALLAHLWLHAGYGHYYYGDWYDGYARFGFLPWHGYHGTHYHRYDPLFVHSRWRFSHRHPRTHHRDYRRQLADNFKHFRRHRQDRPATTFREQQRRFANRNPDTRNRTGIDRINALTAIRDRDFRDRNGRGLRAVDRSVRDRLNRDSGVIQQLRGLRQRTETIRGQSPTNEAGVVAPGGRRSRNHSRTVDLPRTDFSEWVNRNRNSDGGRQLNQQLRRRGQNGETRRGLPERLQSIVPRQRNAIRPERVPQSNTRQRNNETLRDRIRSRVNSGIAGDTGRNAIRIAPPATNQQQRLPFGQPGAQQRRQPSGQPGAQVRRRPDIGALRGNNSAGSGRESGIGALRNLRNLGARSPSNSIRVPSNSGRSLRSLDRQPAVRRQPSIGNRRSAPAARSVSPGRSGGAARALSGRSIGNRIRSGLSGRLGRSGSGNRSGGGILGGRGGRGGRGR